MQFSSYDHFNDDELRELLEDFYKKHDPDELDFIDDVLNLAFELGPVEIDMYVCLCLCLCRAYISVFVVN